MIWKKLSFYSLDTWSDMYFFCELQSPGHVYSGHSSHVTNVQFLYDDSRLISLGGKDSAIMQWQVIDQGGFWRVTRVPDSTDDASILAIYCWFFLSLKCSPFYLLSFCLHLKYLLSSCFFLRSREFSLKLSVLFFDKYYRSCNGSHFMLCPVHTIFPWSRLPSELVAW